MANLRKQIEAGVATGFNQLDKLDPGFREYVESYVASHDFESRVFDSNKIRNALNAYFEGHSDNFRLLSIFATLAVGLPMFLRKRPRYCPSSAVHHLAQS